MSMEQGSINGIPVWLSTVTNSGGERTVIKEAAGVNGATVETQGQMPQRWSISFTLIQDGQWILDDVEGATLDLRSMLLAGGPFTLTAPTITEVGGLWLDGGYELQFLDESRRRLSTGSLTLVDAEPIPILIEDALSLVEDMISSVTEASALDFANRAPEIGFSPAAVSRLDAFAAWLAGVSALIGNALEAVDNVDGQISNFTNNLEGLLNAPANFASYMSGVAAGLLSLVPSLASGGDPLLGSAAVQDPTTDKAKNVLVGAADLGLNFDAGLPQTQAQVLGGDASEQDLAEQSEVDAAVSLSLVSVIASVSLASANSSFTTVQSVLDLGLALGAVVERLENLDGIDYRVLGNARTLWAATRKQLAEQAAGLPRLITITLERDTDVLTLAEELYADTMRSEDAVQAAVDSLAIINDLPDLSAIPRGTSIDYLDPLVT